MSKYILKKDLPFFNKGREVDAVVKDNLRQEVFIRLGAKVQYLPYYKLFDWIEEVKPREWTLLKANNGEIVNASEGFDQFNFKGSLAGIAERIKVREVIE